MTTVSLILFPVDLDAVDDQVKMKQKALRIRMLTAEKEKLKDADIDLQMEKVRAARAEARVAEAQQMAKSEILNLKSQIQNLSNNSLSFSMAPQVDEGKKERENKVFFSCFSSISRFR